MLSVITFLFAALTCVRAKEVVWFGTAPFCQAQNYKCNPFDMTLVKLDAYGDGKKCLTGLKAECVLKNKPNVIEKYKKHQDQNIIDLSLMSYNIFERPYIVTHDGQLERTCRIPRVLATNYAHLDVIAIQENFMQGCDPSISYKDIFPHFGWHYVSEVVGSTYNYNGGVRIISRHPLYDFKSHVFKASSIGTADNLVAKGFVYAKIQKGNHYVHLIATHLQATDCSTCDATRQMQIEEIKKFIDDNHFPTTEPVILMGDLNVDPSRKTTQLDKMLNTLNMERLTNKGEVPYTYDNVENDLVPKEDLREWLDYILVSRGHKMHNQNDYDFRAVKLKSLEEFSFCSSAPLSPYWIFEEDGLCRTAQNTHMLSDHFPVMATLKFRFDGSHSGTPHNNGHPSQFGGQLQKLSGPTNEPAHSHTDTNFFG